jgi:pyruvate-ferredoxin/flavodoxin oxidoreductase
MTCRTPAWPVDASFDIEPPDVVRALFYGLGADGTVGANKNSTIILAADPNRHAQGYFRLRLEEVRFLHDLAPAVRSPAGSRALSPEVGQLRRHPQVRVPLQARHARGRRARRHGAAQQPLFVRRRVGRDPAEAQQQIIDKHLKVHVIDASKVASGLGLGSRVNTILQTCFFALSGVMPREKAIEAIKAATERTYARKGKAIVQKNFQAIDSALANLHEVRVPSKAAGPAHPADARAESAPEFVRDVIAPILAMRGDALPVSALPVDGTYPTGTTDTRSGTSPTRCRSGNRTSASSAASARSSARTA